MSNTSKKIKNIDIATFIKTIYKKPVMDFLTEFAAILKIEDETSLDAAIALSGELMDIVPDEPNHPLSPLLIMLADAIQEYESRIYPREELSLADILRALMEEHGLKHADLADIFGSSEKVEQILSGESTLNNLDHIHQLGKRFQVNPAVFLL